MSKNNKSIYTIIRELMAKGSGKEEAIREATRRKETAKKPGQLSKGQKIKMGKSSIELLEKMQRDSEFLIFVEKITKNYEYLLQDRFVIEATGERGKYPKIDINDEKQRELYDRFTMFIGRIETFGGLSEEFCIKNALNNIELSEVERNILQNRLNKIDLLENEKICK